MFFKPKSPTEVALAQLEKEMKQIEKKLPVWKRFFRYFFTGRAYLAKEVGEKIGFGVATLLFWTTPAKVWAAAIPAKLQGLGEVLKSFWEATLVVLHLSSNT